MSQARILIVEDEVSIACDIAFNLEAHGYHIVGICHNVEGALELLTSKPIDLVMLDINLDGNMTGIDLASRIDKEYGIPFIFVTSYADEDTINSAAHTFPASYLVKPFKEDDLAPAVKMALVRKQSDRMQRLPSLSLINQKLLSKITPSEYTLLSELWNGKSNLEISRDIFISVNTVKTHIQNIYSKMGVHSKPELIRFVRELK
ncbi:MAG: response regulator [Saprospiraceae bacterium]